MCRPRLLARRAGDGLGGFLGDGIGHLQQMHCVANVGDAARHHAAAHTVLRAGGAAPVVVQAMTNTDTADVDATVRQVVELARAGSELVRVTVNTDQAAAAVPHIVDRLAARLGRLRARAARSDEQRHEHCREREGDDATYFANFGPDGYAFGINTFIYGLTH